jgi:predicted dienelactone hydrolase
VAQGAGHFAFLAPCSPEQAQSSPAICQDAAAFDRAQFHHDFNAKVVEFFKANL